MNLIFILRKSITDILSMLLSNRMLTRTQMFPMGSFIHRISKNLWNVCRLLAKRNIFQKILAIHDTYQAVCTKSFSRSFSNTFKYTVIIYERAKYQIQENGDQQWKNYFVRMFNINTKSQFLEYTSFRFDHFTLSININLINE